MSRDQEALVDILEAIKLILQYAEGQDLDTLAANIEKQDAIPPVLSDLVEPPS